jgi:hypothetical protein
MLVINLKVDGDKAWPELTSKNVTEVKRPIHVAGLAGGLVSGKPSVTIRFDLSENEVVLAQTSLALFLTVADLLKARYGDPRVF